MMNTTPTTPLDRATTEQKHTPKSYRVVKYEAALNPQGFVVIADGLTQQDAEMLADYMHRPEPVRVAVEESGAPLPPKCEAVCRGCGAQMYWKHPGDPMSTAFYCPACGLTFNDRS